MARLPAGLVRPFRAARPEEVAAAERALGRSLPEAYASFLRSFDGADLFHEAIVLAGVGPEAPRSLVALNLTRSPDRRVEEELVFAEAADGDRFALAADGHVVRLGAEPEPERWRAGSDFARWLDATIAHDRVLYDSDGEFAEHAFDPDGGEILPLMVLRQAERALRVDPGSADAEHERGVALRRLDRLEDSVAAFRRAATLDPPNPWPWFDLGRVAMTMGTPGARPALEAFEAAATRLGPGPTGARAWAWAARAAGLCALPERIERCRGEALACEPGLTVSLRRARDTAVASLETGDGDPEELHEAEALLEALEGPIPRGRVRLPTLPADPPGPAPVRRPPR